MTNSRPFTLRRALLSSASASLPTSVLLRRQTESSIFSTQSDFRQRSQSFNRESSSNRSSSNWSNRSDSWSNLVVGQTPCRHKTTLSTSNSRLSSSVENLCASSLRLSSETVNIPCVEKSFKVDKVTLAKPHHRQSSRRNKRNTSSSSNQKNKR